MNTKRFIFSAILLCPLLAISLFSLPGDTVNFNGVRYRITVEDDINADYRVAVDYIHLQPHVSVPASFIHNGRDYKITSMPVSNVFPSSGDSRNPFHITKVDFSPAQYLDSMHMTTHYIEIDTLIIAPNIQSGRLHCLVDIDEHYERPAGVKRIFTSGTQNTFMTSSFTATNGMISVIEADITSLCIDTLWGLCGSFSGARWMEKVRVPNTVERMAMSFYCCEHLRDIIMPDSLTDIGHRTFSACIFLDSIVIPAKVRSVHPTFALATHRLKRFVVDSRNGHFKADSGVLYTKSGRTLRSIPHSLPQDTLFLPEIVDSVGELVCAHWYGNECAHPGLWDTLPSVIRHMVFNPGLEYLSKNAFHQVPFKTAANFGRTHVTDIPYCCFSFSRIEGIELPGELTTIGDYAFSGCGFLDSVRFCGSAVTSIGKGVFGHCYALDSLDLSAQTRLRTISRCLCGSCTSLRSVRLPNGIDSIGDSAFFNCPALNLIEVPVLEPVPINKSVFDGVDKATCRLVVPSSSIARYRSAPFWREFLNVGSGNLAVLSVLSSDSVMGSVSESRVCRIGDRVFVYATPNPGYKFTGWSDDPSNPGRTRYVTLSSDTVITAAFAVDPDYVYNVAVSPSDPAVGYTTASLPYAHYGDLLTVSATARTGYRFTRWSNGVTDNPYTLTVVSDTSLTAHFEPLSVPGYTVSAFSSDTLMGTVSGGGTYSAHSEIQLVATANDGYAFTQWADASGQVFTDNPLAVVVVSDTVFTAFFRSDGTSLPAVPYTDSITVSPDGTLHLSGNFCGQMTLFTIAGRLVYTGEVCDMTLPRRGTYILTVGSVSVKIIWQ